MGSDKGLSMWSRPEVASDIGAGKPVCHVRRCGLIVRVGGTRPCLCVSRLPTLREVADIGAGKAVSSSSLLSLQVLDGP